MILRKLIKASAEKILAISFAIISISIASTSSSLSKETELAEASRADIILYRQIFTNYFCITRKSNVKFEEALSQAAQNITAIIINKHGGILEELNGKKITNNQLLNGSTNLIIESAILSCPNQVPEKAKKEFRRSIQEQNKSIENKNKKK